MSSFYEVPIVSIRLVKDGGFFIQRDRIQSPGDVATLLLNRMCDLDREVMVVVHLDTRNQILSIENAAVGALGQTTIVIRELFKGAILANAATIIVAHNHPSGDPTPSPEDIEVTKQIWEAGDLLGIELLDHIVIGHSRFISLREQKLGFP